MQWITLFDVLGAVPRSIQSVDSIGQGFPELGISAVHVTIVGGRKRTMEINGVKVFSATKARDREELGETVTRWLREMAHAHQGFRILDKVVTQSSDSEFHCISMTFFYAT